MSAFMAQMELVKMSDAGDMKINYGIVFMKQ